MTMTDTSTTPAPARISRTGALQAALAGGAAQRAGKDITDCPHPTGPGSTLTDRFLARFWVRGYGAAETG